MAKKNKQKQSQPQGPVKSDAELDEIIAKNKKTATIGTVVIILGVVLLFFLGLIFGGVGIVIGVIVIIIGGAMRGYARGAIKECMTGAALIPALEEVFDNVRYNADGHIPESFIRHTDMGFDFSIDKVYGSDYIKAEYKGVSIEMSDVSLITVSEYTDDDGEIKETESTRFRGLWIICDFHKQFTADLLLRGREGLLGGLARSSIQTENQAFNKQFYIQSDSDHDVFYILTPHMMEYIQAMDKKADARTYMRFLRKGKLVLALDSGRDSFEVTSIRKASAAALREQFISEIRYVTELIDELKLVKTLHKVPGKQN